jgi:hypothetical protein
MAGKITEYPNQATEFDADDKFDVSAKTGVSTYQSKWYSPATLYNQVVNFITDLFVKQITVDRATMMTLISTSSVIPNARYEITDAEAAFFKIIVYGISPNKITDYCYILRPSTSFFVFDYSSVGRYDIASDIVYFNDYTVVDGYGQLALRYYSSLFRVGQTIEINDAAQGKVRVFVTDKDSTSTAAFMPGNQNLVDANIEGYWGRYNAAEDVFVHDIVHFRTEVDSATINTATSTIDIDIIECPKPPLGYAWEVLSANVSRELGDSYGAGLVEVGIATLTRGQYTSNSILNLGAETWRQIKANDTSTSITIIEDERLSVILSGVSATGTGDIVVYGTARLMKK